MGFFFVSAELPRVCLRGSPEKKITNNSTNYLVFWNYLFIDTNIKWMWCLSGFVVCIFMYAVPQVGILQIDVNSIRKYKEICVERIQNFANFLEKANISLWVELACDSHENVCYS